MVILVLFAFLAGVVTIFAPCILPLLPIVLSAGLSGGKQRPLGIVTGLVASFTFFTLSLSYLTRKLGLDPDILRTIAIISLLGFGALLLFPRALIIFEGWISRFIPKTQANNNRTDFLGGVLIGISLGLVWTPCVGPIIASVITLSVTSSVTATSVLITAAYAMGTSIPLLAITYGGKRLITRMKSFTSITPRLQMIFGVIMILTAGSMLIGFDRKLQAALLAKLPSGISSGLTQGLEQSNLVQNELKKLSGKDETAPSSTQLVGGQMKGLPELGKAPEFTGINHWLNSDPLTLAGLKGKVVLVDFWTYSCINCIRTLPYVTSWYDTYKDQGFVVVGVHAPEFAFEQKTENVAAAIKQYAIHYPVAQDNDFKTWNAYGNQYWPAHYLIDAKGVIRSVHFGEGKYAETEANIRALLKEAKEVALPTPLPKPTENTIRDLQTPETYLGEARRERFVTSDLGVDEWNLTGDWQTQNDSITSGKTGDTLNLKFRGSDVFLVLNPPEGSTGKIKVLLDGKPIESEAGANVKDSVVEVSSDKLYHLVNLKNASKGSLLTLVFENPGIKAFAFTFN